MLSVIFSSSTTRQDPCLEKREIEVILESGLALFVGHHKLPWIAKIAAKEMKSAFPISLQRIGDELVLVWVNTLEWLEVSSARQRHYRSSLSYA